MKKTIIILISLLFAIYANAEKSKTVEKRVPTSPGQKINIEGISGSEVSFESWDKNEVYIKLQVSISSSNDDYEKDYIESVEINESQTSSSVSLKFKERKHKDDGWTSIFKIFKNFYIQKEITGVVYVPQSNPLTTDISYGTVSLDNMKGDVELKGTSNTLTLKNCTSVKKVENNYGNTTIENSGGSLKLDATSSTVDINGFDGEVIVNADYSTVKVRKISKATTINDVSGKITIEDVKGNLTVDANYSTITLDNVDGFADITTTSGKINARTIGGIKVIADYSDIEVSNVSGKSGKVIYIESQSGKLLLEDATGDVRIKNPYSNMDLARINGDVEISTSSGSVEAEEIKGDWKSTTEYSDIIVRNLYAKNVFASNSSNKVSFTLKTVPNTIDIKNQYGNVKVNMPSGFSGSIELDSEYGSIETNLPIKIKSRSSSESGNGRIGNGDGTITIETESGNIELIQK